MNMVRHNFVLGCVLLLLSGCAARVPQTVELGGRELKKAKDRLETFLNQSCVASVDSDVRLGWKAYGREDAYAAELQAGAPASFRLALTDPLGRPIVLLGSNGRRFTLADNRSAVGYTGSTELKFIRRFLPGFIPVDDLFFWLSGRIRRDELQVGSMRMDAAEQLGWYEFASMDGSTAHMLALNPTGQMVRHVVVDARTKEILFEASYGNFAKTPETCLWPGRIELSGSALEAGYSIEFTKIYSFEPIDGQRFRIDVPPHFARKEMTDR